MDKIHAWRCCRKLAMLPVIAALFAATACAQQTAVPLPSIDKYDMQPKIVENRNLRLGVVPGPYGDMFLEAVAPSLEKHGYIVQLIVYDDYIEPNLALERGDIDLNMFQHYRYLNNFKFENNLNLTAISEIPTVSMGVYSNRYADIDALPDGAEVSLPDDETNLARAIKVLEAAGLVRIAPSVDKSKATLADIISNPKSLNFTALKAQNLVSSLARYDLAVINGNFAVSGGLRVSDALYSEILDDGYMNVIAVRTDDLGLPFVNEVIKAVHSYDFKSVVSDEDGPYAGFQLPRNFTEAVSHVQ